MADENVTASENTTETNEQAATPATQASKPAVPSPAAMKPHAPSPAAFAKKAPQRPATSTGFSEADIKATEAFGRVAGAQDVAIIAGRNRDAALVGRLRAAAQWDDRLRLYPEFVPDERMQCYLLAADVMVAPFEHVLTSSSVMVGLSYGLPVIAPNRGCLPELVTAEAGLIYRAEEPDGLARALTDIKSRDLAAMGAAARRVAATWCHSPSSMRVVETRTSSSRFR